MDGRVVGRLVVARGGVDLVLLEQRLGVLAEVSGPDELIEQGIFFEVVRVDRVVRPRIRDIPGRVEVFGDAHRALGGVAQ